MSGPGRTEDFLYNCFKRYNGGIETYAWAEDIDLSAAVGALAAMVGSCYDALYVGTDSIRTRKGFGTPQLLGIMGIDEAGAGAGGYITVQGRTRAIYFGKMSNVAAGEYWLIDFLDNPVALPEGSKLDCVGNQSGAGAEQHAVIVVIGYPKLARHKELDPLSFEGPIGLKTGTRVAGTFGPKSSDLLGDYLAFENSEESFSQDESIRYALCGLINGPGLADTSVVGIRYPRSGEAPDLELYVPASMAGSESYFKWPKIMFEPENPGKLGAFGNAVTSDEYGLHMGLSVPYGDFDNRGTLGGQAGGQPAPTPSTVAPKSNELRVNTSLTVATRRV